MNSALGFIIYCVQLPTISEVKNSLTALTSAKKSASLSAEMFKPETANAEDTGDTGLIPVSGRSPGGGNGNPLQYSC